MTVKWRVESHVVKEWWYSKPRRVWVAYDDRAETYEEAWGSTSYDTQRDFPTWEIAFNYALTEARSQYIAELAHELAEQHRDVLDALGRGADPKTCHCPACVGRRAGDECPPGVHSIFDPCPGNCGDD